MSTPDTSWQDGAFNPVVRQQLTRTRLGIRVVAVVFGVIAVISLVGFAVNLTLKYPGTEKPVITVDPLWMAGHVVRAFALGWLTYRLWRYQSALKHWHRPSPETTETIIRSQATTWLTGAVALVILMLSAILQVGFTAGW